MDSNLYNEIVDVVAKTQLNRACHQKCRVLLLNIYNKSDRDEFYICFENILRIMLNKDPKLKNPYVEKAIDFCMSFCAATEINETEQSEYVSFFETVLKFLLDLHNLHSDIVRYRVCQFINKLLNNLTGSELNEELCNKIEDAMLERLQYDTKSEIRFQAVSAAYRMQNARNVHCKIFPQLICHMNNDASLKVRKICVEKIDINRDVVVALVSRTRDVNSEVRLAAFKRISTLAKALKITERHVVITNGFVDSAKDVVDFVSNKFVVTWLNEYDGDYLKLIHAFRLNFTENEIKESTRVIGLVLKALFRIRPYEEILDVLKIGEDRLLSLENVNWESAIYWRFVINCFRKSDKHEDLLDSVLPELVHFAAYIKKYLNYVDKSTEAQFVVNELFIITQGYDVSDSVSRDVLTKLVVKVLHDIDLLPDVVVTVLNNLKITIPNLDLRIKFISETISDILHPAVEEEKTDDAEFQIAQKKVQIHSIEEKLRLAVQEEDYDSAAKLKHEIDIAKSILNEFQTSLTAPPPVSNPIDTFTIIKCLNIARALLLWAEVTCLNPILRTLNEDITSNFLVHDDLRVSTIALECYALCCIVDQKCAEKGISIFTTCILANTIAPTNNTSSLIISIKAVCDLLVLYGQTLIQQSEEDEEIPTISATQIIQALVDLMNDENMELQECATIALCNLILHGRIHSPALISRMILKWCNPASEDNENMKLQQIIGMMLEKLPTLIGAAHLLENSVLPTVKTLDEAPKSSPLSEVNIQTVVKFMLSLCYICEENCNLHCNLALKICIQINDKPDQAFNIILSKILLMLDMKPEAEFVYGLRNICDDILENVSNRVVLKNIQKFMLIINKLGNEETDDVSIIHEVIEE